MENNIKMDLQKLKLEYKYKKKQAISKEDFRKIKQDYKNMKQMIKAQKRLINEDVKFQKESDKFWSSLKSPELDNTDTIKLNSINDTNFFGAENSSQNEEQSKVLKQADELLNKIDEKIDATKSEPNVDRSSYFTYQKGDIEFAKSLCELCKYNNANDSCKCEKYPDKKPDEIISNKNKCDLFEIKPLE